jgi:homocysteine S-methyltransferase
MQPVASLDLNRLHTLDGGMATELEKLGCDLSSPLWSGEVLRTRPEQIKAVHAAYLEAGADCLLTASYQISAMGFREVGLPPQEAAAALRRAVQLAEQARAEYWQTRGRRPVWIAASLGPYGAALHNGAEFHGNYDCSFSDLVAFHRERLLALATSGADFLALETIPSLQEARAILEALQAVPALPAYISFTCRDARHVAHGEELSACAHLLDRQPQIIAVGVNCTAPSLIEPLIGELTGVLVGELTGEPKRVIRKKIVVYPNSGEQWHSASRAWTGHSDPSSFGSLAQTWRRAGADWIGGCCRTGPEHIRAIARSLAAAGA